ncbi:MAG: hypothetical protein ABW321_20225 [Polyangiales bacterium]
MRKLERVDGSARLILSGARPVLNNALHAGATTRSRSAHRAAVRLAPSQGSLLNQRAHETLLVTLPAAGHSVA